MGMGQASREEGIIEEKQEEMGRLPQLPTLHCRKSCFLPLHWEPLTRLRKFLADGVRK